MKSFAYVLYIERTISVISDAEEHLVSLHQNLDEAEAALRDYVATVFVGPTTDDDIVETLAGVGIYARIYACTKTLVPFARTARAA